MGSIKAQLLPVLLTKLRGALLGAAAALAASTPVCGAEGPFGFIYTLDLQPQGTWQVQQWEHLQQGQSRGKYSYLRNRTEFEYGVTDWYQVGLYLNSSYGYAWHNGFDGSTSAAPGIQLSDNFDPAHSYSRARFESVSMETVIKLLNPYIDPIGFGIYIEPEFGPNERELEVKLLFQKNFLGDRLVTAANLVFATEHEQHGEEVEKASMMDILVGASYRVADNWMAGVEFRNHREWEGYWWNHPEHSAYFLGPPLL
jgi:opacity protein-like surface antigen